MVWIKICGLARLADACLASELGANAVGFIFCPSPRKINPPIASQIMAQLPARIARVGVFCNQPIAEVAEIARLCRLDYLQFHGQEDLEYCRHFGQQAIKAIRVSSPGDLADLGRYGTELVVLDSYVPGQAGGTGQRFSWHWLSNQVVQDGTPRNEFPKIILAGGLNPDNVWQALTALQPFGVDVSSGIEEAPGIKDPVKLRAFIEQVRRWEGNK